MGPESFTFRLLDGHWNCPGTISISLAARPRVHCNSRVWLGSALYSLRSCNRPLLLDRARVVGISESKLMQTRSTAHVQHSGPRRSLVRCWIPLAHCAGVASICGLFGRIMPCPPFPCWSWPTHSLARAGFALPRTQLRPRWRIAKATTRRNTIAQDLNGSLAAWF